MKQHYYRVCIKVIMTCCQYLLQKAILLFYGLILLVFCQPDLKGQDYHPMIRDNAYWDVMKASSMNPCLYENGFRYYFEGDTIIQSIQYKIVRGYSIVGLGDDFCPPYEVEPSNPTIQGYMREDISTRKIFLYDLNFGDVLLYDFNLAENDTLETPLYNEYPIVDSIRTFALLNGENRKIYYLNFQNYGYPQFYIESIGGSQGLCFPMIEYFDLWYEPGCIIENGISLIDWPMWWGIEDCYLWVGYEERFKNNKTSLYPNPVHINEYLHILSGKSSKAIILNSNGTFVKKMELGTSTFQSNNLIKINKQNFKTGLYCIIFITPNKQNHYEKFIVVD